MYKSLIAVADSQIQEHLDTINKENGKLLFVPNDKYKMYFIYEVSEHRSEI